MIMNIVVGNDGRTHSEKAAEYAFAYAKAFQANLFMLYIVNPKTQEDKEKSIKNGMRGGTEYEKRQSKKADKDRTAND